MTDLPHSGVREPHERLLDARDALHLVSGRATDRLLLEQAGPVASRLGYDEPDELRRWTDDLRTRVLAKPRRSASGRGVAGEPYAEVRKLLDRSAARVALLPLVVRERLPLDAELVTEPAAEGVR